MFCVFDKLPARSVADSQVSTVPGVCSPCRSCSHLLAEERLAVANVVACHAESRGGKPDCPAGRLPVRFARFCATKSSHHDVSAVWGLLVWRDLRCDQYPFGAQWKSLVIGVRSWVGCLALPADGLTVAAR